MRYSLADAAIRQADERSARELVPCVVWLVKGPDRWGRSDVFYVRLASDPPPDCAEKIYQTVIRHLGGTR